MPGALLVSDPARDRCAAGGRGRLPSRACASSRRGARLRTLRRDGSPANSWSRASRIPSASDGSRRKRSRTSRARRSRSTTAPGSRGTSSRFSRQTRTSTAWWSRAAPTRSKSSRGFFISPFPASAPSSWSARCGARDRASPTAQRTSPTRCAWPASQSARGRGTLVVMHGQVLSARNVRKRHATDLGAFDAPEPERLGVSARACASLARRSGCAHAGQPRAARLTRRSRAWTCSLPIRVRPAI